MCRVWRGEGEERRGGEEGEGRREERRGGYKIGSKCSKK